MIDKRKAWMKDLKAIPFSRDGLMAQETARAQRNANTKRARCVTLSRNLREYPEHIQQDSLTGEGWKRLMKGEGFTLYGEVMAQTSP